MLHDSTLDNAHVGLDPLNDSTEEILMTTGVYEVQTQEAQEEVETNLTLDDAPLVTTGYQPYPDPQHNPLLLDGFFLSSSDSSSATSSMPLNLPFDTSLMGHKNFQHLTDLSPIVLEARGDRVRNTNSPFSDHISLVEHLIAQEWRKPTIDGGRELSPR